MDPKRRATESIRIRSQPRAPVAAAFLLLLVCPGCLSPGERAPPRDDDAPPDASVEWWNATIRPDGPFRFGLPVPLAALSDLDAWAANARGTNATVEAGADAAGPVLWVTGSGDAEIGSSLRRGPGAGRIAEKYLEARWSTNTTAQNPRAVAVAASVGNATIEILYSGTSLYCGRFARFTGSASAPGRAQLPGEDTGVCG